MASSPNALIRTIAATLTVAGGLVAAGAGPASPAPAYVSHPIRYDFFGGEIAAAHVIVDAATNGTGTVRFTVGALRASFDRSGRTFGNRRETVSWLNVANGRAGSARVGATPTTAVTGRGPVVVTVTGEFGLPAVGVVDS